MEIWMTSSTESVEFAATFALAKARMEPIFNQRFGELAYGSGLVELQYCARHHALPHEIVGETKKYAKASHTAHIYANLEVPANCSVKEMITSVATSLASHIVNLRKFKISNFDIDRFCADYANFAMRESWTVPLGFPAVLPATPCQPQWAKAHEMAHRRSQESAQRRRAGDQPAFETAMR
ncbi:hypothetical protein [Massilia sp. PWRC2]|uniref:hypothetical protein n=1 Tax=Massilia sp. PWRC2 TaxID=2804626 RepID=UPI003CF0C659